LLKKQAEKYGSQQKALEHALECQENENNSKSISRLSPEEEMTVRIVQSKLACLLEKQGLKHMLEYLNMEPYLAILNNDKLLQYQLEVYFQKPLKDCSLKEVVDGMIVNAKLGNWFETLSYTDDGDHYTFNATHNLGLNCSKINESLFEGLFKSYGARVNITTSERTIFMKIYKN
jgi:hypothetical protein